MVECPQCSSQKVWKDGTRRLAIGESVQRYLCRICGYRFSEPKVKLNICGKLGKTLNSGPNLLDGGVISHDFSFQKGFNDLPFSGRENVGSHKLTVVGKQLNSFPSYNSKRQICDPDKGTKNLIATEQKQTVAGELQKTTRQDAKGKIVEFGFWLQKQGYKSALSRHKMIKRLVDLGADLWDPESVKLILAKQTKWKDGYKMLMTYAYENFLRMEGLTWQRPRYRQEHTLPFIPTEQELNQLISGVGKKVGVFLQGLKDTGCDPGELAKLRWIDLNNQTRTANITPVKGHLPRVLKVSVEFIRRLEALPKKSEYIFNYVSLKSGYPNAREHLARKLNNPRLLKVSFTTFRHWKGTMEYHKTKDILHVKKLLGHKRIENTMVYINLEAALFTDQSNEFHAAVAKTTKEACNLVKVGFEYVTGEYQDGGKIFRKRK